MIATLVLNPGSPIVFVCRMTACALAPMIISYNSRVKAVACGEYTPSFAAPQNAATNVRLEKAGGLDNMLIKQGRATQGPTKGERA
jgi:hypothetical protein